MKSTPSKTFIVLLVIVLSGYTSEGQPNQPPISGKPNIIIVIPDDLGWSDVGYQGSAIQTPNIDKLAGSGTRFNQQYVMPTCTPTRVSLMTGLYPSRYGVTAPDYGEVIDLGDPTLASMLSENGYYTALAGKWHMGSVPYTPLKYGFQSSYGYLAGQIDPYTHEYKNGERSWHRNDEFLDEEGHATDLITKEAVRIIREKRENPYFLYVAYSVPHYPLNEPDEWTAMYDNVSMSPSRKAFSASVTHMDAGIGKILEALDQSGQRENTLILFISDNGGQFSWHSDTQYHGNYADKPHEVLGNNYPLRGWKGDVYEGGIRVPAIVSWPGHLSKKTIDIPIHVSDWLPTLSYLTGSEEYLEDLNLDGQNIWPLLTNEQSKYAGHPMYWKTGQEYAVRDGNWKLIVDIKSNKVELYDLKNDFRESKDLSESHPKEKQHLLSLLEGFKKGDR